MTKTALLEPGKLWWNWFGEQYFVPLYTAQPTTEAEVRELVLSARKLGLPVRCSGAGHSNPALVPTPGIHVNFDKFNDVLDGASLCV
jgi:FAD/FMN-containing dehydrogenase